MNRLLYEVRFLFFCVHLFLEFGWCCRCGVMRFLYVLATSQMEAEKRHAAASEAERIDRLTNPDKYRLC